MSPKSWDTVKRVFHEALDQPEERRAEHLSVQCAGDRDLRSEVERLLAMHEQSHEFLETPAVDDSALEAMLGPEGSLPPGSRVGSYTIRDVIGEGGMGIVYRALQDGAERTVALKVLRSGIAGGEVATRFKKETQLLGRLQHRGIARILEAGTSDTNHGTRPFFAMELIEGLPATRYVEERGLSTAQRLELLAKIADAVDHAHQKGIIHRDLKPANILVDTDGQPKVLDFGVARAVDSDVYLTTLRTDIGKLIGTIPYMSPEQVAGDPRDLDTRSDVYALGVVGYELLTGRLPYDLADKPIPEAVRIIGYDDPTPLSSINQLFRGDVETILGKALEKDRSRRYQSAAELATDIRRYLQKQPIVARPASTFFQLRRFSKRNKALVSMVVLAFMALVAGIVGTTWQSQRAKEQLRTANAVNLFLHDLLESPSTGKHQRNVTVLELFDKVPRELESRFPDKPEVKAPIYLAVGNTYQQVGLVDKAESYVRKAHEYFVEAFGEENKQTLNAMAWLALLLERQGKLTEAEALGRRTCEVRTRICRPEETHAIGAIVNLANVLRLQGRFDETAKMLREGLEHHAAAGRHEGVNTLYARAILASSLTVTGKLGEAEELAQNAHDGFQEIFGDDDWRTMFASSVKARIWQAQGRNGEAETLLRSVLEQRRRVLGDQHPDTISSLYELASILASKREHAESLTLTSEALERAEGVMRSEHWRIARLERLQGECLFSLNRFSEAREILLRARDRLTTELGPDHFETLAARNLLQSIDGTLGVTSEAGGESPNNSLEPERTSGAGQGE